MINILSKLQNQNKLFIEVGRVMVYHALLILSVWQNDLFEIIAHKKFLSGKMDVNFEWHASVG